MLKTSSCFRGFRDEIVLELVIKITFVGWGDFDRNIIFDLVGLRAQFLIPFVL